MRHDFIGFSIIITLLFAGLGIWVSSSFFWAFVVIGPFVVLGVYDMLQKRHAIVRNFPVFGRGRYLMEYMRPKLYQYFVESDINGRPFNRVERSLIYQRAKKELDTSAFGTQLDVYEVGYEWMNHSIAAIDYLTINHDQRVAIGEGRCKQPYNASLLNVSAMSYGALSANAVMALNGGAKLGNFAHNTGEGGISPYHLQGGDLIFQVGTGYFGARDKAGNFSTEVFAESAAHDQVKMIELKLSQGAKPGHGGILPAGKNTPEIASIRKVEPYTTVLSPAFHTAFKTPVGLLELLAVMREASGGKPVGFKLCVGNKIEFLSICKAMVDTGIVPDFISVDGGEGGTGASPLEFTNSVGMPFREGLVFVHDTLTGFNLRDKIKLIAAGKIISGFHIFRALALGADVCYSARAMMMALGCIQALECNKNTCPTGVTTHRKELTAGLVVSDKRVRVADYQKDTMAGFIELMGGAGIDDPCKINRSHIYRRTSITEIKTFEQIFPYLKPGCLLHEHSIPESYQMLMKQSGKDSFVPTMQYHIT